MKQSLQVSTRKADAYDDDISPPSSPPPVHLIYFPESYHYAGNNSSIYGHMPDNMNNNDERKKRVQGIPYYAAISRRKLFNVAKLLINFVFKNNNLLLIIHLVHRLLKQRMQLIRPIVSIAKQAAFVIRHNSYKQCMRHLVHFIQYHAAKAFANNQQFRIATASNNRRLSNMVALATTMTVFIKSLGGLDSIVLAICTIAFTKSLHSDRIF